ncbi:MAG TPA: DUF2127 domain-containing protein [Burkholderiales bacterium]|nr:DUF2127 domain-containing protein [Burkholderiales bacterium]
MLQFEMSHHPRADLVALRMIALFEAFKGILVLAVGTGLLTLLHRDVQKAAEQVILHLHLDPARHVPLIFLTLAAKINDSTLMLLAAGALVYSIVRLLEAYGLWNARPWAEWLGVLTGGFYLFIEVYELAQRATLLRFSFFAVNLAIVVYLGWTLRRKKAASG